jgi:DNA polymerase-1
VGNRLAQDFIQRYFAKHTKVKEYLEGTLKTAREQGWVTTLLGRRRQIPQITSSNRLLRQEAERSAINTPLQGSAADLIKKAMLEVDRALRQQGSGARLLLQLHDELLLEVPGAEVKSVARLVKQAMEGVASLKVPLVVDLRVGSNWGEMSPLR